MFFYGTYEQRTFPSTVVFSQQSTIGLVILCDLIKCGICLRPSLPLMMDGTLFPVACVMALKLMCSRTEHPYNGINQLGFRTPFAINAGASICATSGKVTTPVNDFISASICAAPGTLPMQTRQLSKPFRYIT